MELMVSILACERVEQNTNDFEGSSTTCAVCIITLFENFFKLHS